MKNRQPECWRCAPPAFSWRRRSRDVRPPTARPRRCCGCRPSARRRSGSPTPTTSGPSSAPAGWRAASPASRGRRRIRTFHPTASRSPSAANTPATSTSMSCPPKAASRSGSRGTPAPIACRAGCPTASPLSLPRAARRPRRAARRASGPCPRRAASSSRCLSRAPTRARFLPSGTHVAYRMNNSWDDERRNYRGGQNRPIWIVDLKTFDLVSPPWTDSKDIDPVWVGDTVFFLSDRDGVSNVWSFETRSKKLAQVTKFTVLRREVDGRQQRHRGVRAGRRDPRARPEERAATRSCRSPPTATSPG